MTAARAGLRQFWRHADRMGLAVFLGGLLLYLPLAGSYGLWDPWETHYGEVARQMTTRNDFISLWWPGSSRETEVFQTKPVLSFWLMSLAMKVVGVGTGAPEEMALGTAAEWAVRAPFCLFGALGLCAVYFVTARLASRRAGLFAAALTATFPMYALVARQAMTDMVFVTIMSWAVALGALALERLPAAPPTPRSGWAKAAAVGLFLLATVPQLLVDSIQLHVALPWNGRRILMYGVVVMLPYWLGVTGVLLYLLRTRRPDLLALTSAATLAGLAVLAKGLAGLGLPVLILVAFLAVRGAWGRLREREFLVALAVSLVIVAVVAIPWHHAMYIRHGAPWWNELFGDNHWNRMVVGRHGDRGTFAYFLRQLGYGAWPVIALVPGALAWAVLGQHDERRRTAVILGAVWFVTAYVVVSLSMTKFHHYLLPALPGLAIVLGTYLDDLLAQSSRHALLLPLTGLPLLGAVTFDLLATQDAAERFLWLFSYDYVHNPSGRPWPPTLELRPLLAGLSGAAALATLAVALTRTRKIGVVALPAVAAVAALVLIDGLMPAVAPFWSQKGTIARYYRERRSPKEALVAYQMFWRGETFYTKNAINEGPADERTVFDYTTDVDARLRDWLRDHRGNRQFFLFEPARESRLRSLLPADAAPTFRIIERTNNKFVLGVADL